MTLEEIRLQIDQIDDQLLDLFMRRMDCAKQVAEVKAREHMPVLNPKREQEILDQVAEKGGEYAGAAKILFATMMDVSRALQHDALGGGEALRQLVENAPDAFECGDQRRVACPGVPGSYSHRAAEHFFQHSALDFYTRFEDVFSAVDAGKADFGVVPVENSSAGSVIDVYDLILKYRFFLVGAADLPIHHCLAAKPGAAFDGIHTVYSHPQGLAQCSEFLAKGNYQICEHTNTAAAAEMVSKQEDKQIAAICSLQAAKEYGLSVLSENIQNIHNNCTRFIVISKRPCIPVGADKISLCFSLPHTTGSLYRTLARFALHGLNLTKIESRPIPGKQFEYFFYLDFSGNVRSPEVLNLICSLSDELPNFSFLGNYREENPMEP